jgi:hypothetical protein
MVSAGGAPGPGQLGSWHHVQGRQVRGLISPLISPLMTQLSGITEISVITEPCGTPVYVFL